MRIRIVILALAIAGGLVGRGAAQLQPLSNRPLPGFTNRPLPRFTNQPLPGYTNRLLPGFTNRFPFSNQPGVTPRPFTNINPRTPGFLPGDENPPTYPPTNRPVPPQPVPPKNPLPGQPTPPG